MNRHWVQTALWIQSMTHGLAMAMIGVAAAAATVTTLLSAAGALPWLRLEASFAGSDPALAGPVTQLFITLFLLLLCVFLPSGARVMRLEAAHRDFAVGMEDVTRAYWYAHAADRAGVFRLDREYDAVRERIHFLQDHPDLADLDAELLELAAQMSHESRDLARLYSDEKVAHAKESLAHRRLEAEELRSRIERASVATAEIRRELTEVELDEDLVKARLKRFREELAELLPSIDSVGVLGEPEERRARMNVVAGE